MAKKPPPGGLTVVPESATIKVGVTQFVFCSEPRASWSSSNSAIASVDGLVRGAVLGVAAGVATITAQYRNKRGHMTITVEAVEVPPVDPGIYGPQTDVTQPPGSVQILPGVSTIQDVIAAHPAGTTYWLTAGTYQLTAPVRPKTGDVLVGEYGAILEGAAVQQDYDLGGIAVVSGWNSAVSGVTVRNLVIRGRDQIMGVGAFGPAAGGWTVDQCEITGCRWGVAFGNTPNGTQATRVYVPGPTITANRITDCLWSGATSSDGSGAYGIQTADGTVMVGNEIARCGGQAKLVACIHSRVASNWLHHNPNGIWFDGDNRQNLIEDNLLEDHAGVGIFYEISAEATIRRNTVRRSGEAGIFLSTSRDLDVYENTLEGNWRDVDLFVNCDVAGLPEDGAYPGSIAYDLSGIHVHDNVFHVGTRDETIAAGLSALGTCDPAFTAPYFGGAKDLVFAGNQYTVPTLSGSYWYWGTFKSWAAWQAIPQDAGGSVGL